MTTATEFAANARPVAIWLTTPNGTDIMVRAGGTERPVYTMRHQEGGPFGRRSFPDVCLGWIDATDDATLDSRAIALAVENSY